jgi:hypothetical protein
MKRRDVLARGRRAFNRQVGNASAGRLGRKRAGSCQIKPEGSPVRVGTPLRVPHEGLTGPPGRL